jgi:ABC-type methionine transport system ATPase subunit
MNMFAQSHNPQVNHQNNVIEMPAKHHITLRVPHNCQQEPIVSNLVSDHGLTVNITAALLGENAKQAKQDGWFNLELVGADKQIQSALGYLEKLDLEFW